MVSSECHDRHLLDRRKLEEQIVLVPCELSGECIYLPVHLDSMISGVRPLGPQKTPYRDSSAVEGGRVTSTRGCLTEGVV